MRRVILTLVSVVLGAAGAGVLPASAGAAGLDEAIRRRYALSRMEIEDDRRQGEVKTAGTVLVLQADAIPANELRVVRPQVHTPRSYVPNPARHLRNYARVEIDPSEARTGEAGAFQLPRGTRLVVLDLRLEADRVRLFTHTAEPVAVGPNRAAYGCTEFVFRLDLALLHGRDPATVEQVIERWLRVEAAGRPPTSPRRVADVRPVTR